MIPTGWRFADVLPNNRVVLEKQIDQSISGDQGKQVQKNVSDLNLRGNGPPEFRINIGPSPLSS